MQKLLKKDIKVAALIAGLVMAQTASAALVADPNDARSWQGATVGTFAQLYYGSDTLANRTLVTTNQLLDDGYFNAAGYTGASLIRYNGVDTVANPGYGTYGTSLDQPNVNNGGNQGNYNYVCCSGPGAAVGANSIDQHWIQTNNVVGHTVFDMGFGASKAAIFNSIDHGPLPGEAIESTVYLSNDQITWTQAVTERVWLEGIYSDTSVVWDGFAYAVGTGTSATFRYASVIWGGPGAIVRDGDNEINGVMGLRGDYTPTQAVPEPETYAMLLAGLGLLSFTARRRKQNLG
jgi:PEP-CTERM motif